MVRHIVAWNFKDELTEVERKDYAEKIKAGLENLVRLIPELISAKVYINLMETSTQDLMLETTFKTKEDLSIYQKHPEHIKVASIVRSVVKQRICLDFNE